MSVPVISSHAQNSNSSSSYISSSSHRLLANLYNGNIYIWNTSDQVGSDMACGSRGLF